METVSVACPLTVTENIRHHSIMKKTITSVILTTLLGLTTSGANMIPCRVVTETEEGHLMGHQMLMHMLARYESHLGSLKHYHYILLYLATPNKNMHNIIQF